MSTWELDREQKTALVRDGFVVLPNVVPMEWVNHAKRLIEEAMPTSERRILAPAELATHPDVIRLFRDSPINEIILAEMGPYPDVVSCQIAITPGGDQLGGKPFPHVDGGWSGPIPTRPEEIEPSRGRPVNPVRYFGENDETRGTNDGLLWQDPDRRISMGSYTALVGIALNNQLVPGNGQFGVLKGMQEEVEAAFGDQRDQGSVIGPEGVGWPRIRVAEDGLLQLNGLPERIRELVHCKSNEKSKFSSWLWPELTPVCLAAGDGVVALHSCPHTATPNFGTEPRMTLHFRLRRWRDGNPHEGTRRVGHGVSDHPDRGYFGQFLDYPDTYDAWGTSISKLCDHWSDWDNLGDFAREYRENSRN